MPDDLFPDLPEMTTLEIRRARLAINLTAMAVHCGVSRASLASKLGWDVGVLNQILDNEVEPTFTQVSEICDALGTDCTLVFGDSNTAQKSQPWAHWLILTKVD